MEHHLADQVCEPALRSRKGTLPAREGREKDSNSHFGEGTVPGQAKARTTTRFVYALALLVVQALAFPGAVTETNASVADGRKAVGEAQFLANVRQLTFEGKRSGEG